jgi:hypothetical protein
MTQLAGAGDENQTCTTGLEAPLTGLRSSSLIFAGASGGHSACSCPMGGSQLISTPFLLSDKLRATDGALRSIAGMRANVPSCLCLAEV